MKTTRARFAWLAWLATSSAACSSGGDGGGPSATPGPSSTPLAPDAQSPDYDGAATPISSPPPAAGGPTSPTPDASSSFPAPPPAPDAGRTCSGAVLCDDFESYPTGPLGLPDAGGRWQIETPNCSGTGAIAIDSSEAHTGTRSLKVTGAAGYCNHVFLGTNAVATLSAEIWARFYVRLATPLTADHATFLAMHDTSTSTDLRMGGQDSVLMWNRASDDATLPEMSPAGTALSVVPTVAAWHCIELAIAPAGPTLETCVDGALVTGLVVGGSAAVAAADGQWVRNTAWSPHLVDARFGWESYASEAETLWFDDIAIGSARIGCGG